MLPLEFKQTVSRLLGQDEAGLLLDALTQTERPVSIRLNPTKMPPVLPAAAKGAVPWSSHGHYLQERPAFTFDPLLHAGCYYVQEAASMFVEQAWRVVSAEESPQRLLDLCAAPGGKSTLWRSLMREGTLLVANEPVRQRAQILAENMAKWGHPDVVCTSAYPEAFAGLGSFFDVIAADVPCSGEGMFRKDEGAVAAWSPEAVELCAARQWKIISDVWPALREGGFLIYSTCTFNREENEDNVWRICRELGAELVAIPVAEEWNIAGDTTGRNLPVYHFFPHRQAGEGFFLALLRKTSEAPLLRERKNKKGKGSPRQAVAGGREVAGWLRQPSQFRLLQSDENHVLAVRESLAEDVMRLTATIKSLTAGIALAELKGRKLVPQHPLALSTQYNPEAFPGVELSHDDALTYLRHEALTLPSDTPRGYVTAKYQGFFLGFLNNLGARANNLYPAEWRIRSAR